MQEAEDEDLGRWSGDGDLERRPRAACAKIEREEAIRILKMGIRAIVGVDSGVREVRRGTPLASCRMDGCSRRSVAFCLYFVMMLQRFSVKCF